MTLSRSRSIVKAVATFSVLSLVPKFIVVAKDAVVAYYFGTGQALDLYLMAFVLIGMPVSVIVVSLQTSLIPALAKRDDKAAAGLLGGAVKLALILLLSALPLWMLSLPYALVALYPGAGEATLSNLLNASYWMIPYYFLNGISLLFYGALQARKVFWPNALLPGLFPVATIIAVGFAQQATIYALLIGTVTGSLLECMVLYGLLARSRLVNWRKTAGSGLRPVLLMSVPLMLGAVVSSMAPLVEQMISFGLGPGAVSILSYGNKVPTALNTLMVTAIGIVVLPHFAELIAAGQRRECRALHFRLSGIVMLIGVAVMSVGLVVAEDIIRLLFERGAFTADDSRLAADVMRVYLWQLPFLLVSMISLRTLAAMGKTWSMASIGTMQLIIAGSLAYMFSTHFGVTGVALGTVVGAAIGAGALGLAAWRGYEEQFD